MSNRRAHLAARLVAISTILTLVAGCNDSGVSGDSGTAARAVLRSAVSSMKDASTGHFATRVDVVGALVNVDGDYDWAGNRAGWAMTVPTEDGGRFRIQIRSDGDQFFSHPDQGFGKCWGRQDVASSQKSGIGPYFPDAPWMPPALRVLAESRGLGFVHGKKSIRAEIPALAAMAITFSKLLDSAVIDEKAGAATAPAVVTLAHGRVSTLKFEVAEVMDALLKAGVDFGIDERALAMSPIRRVSQVVQFGELGEKVQVDPPNPAVVVDIAETIRNDSLPAHCGA